MIDNIDAIIQRSSFFQNWINNNIEIYSKLYPQAKPEDLRRVLTDIARKYAKKMPATIHNNYTGSTVNTDTLTVYDWVDKTHPICAGNGTFFKNQDQASSPISDIIDGRISARKSYQKIRDGFLYDTSCYEYQYYDMMQAEAKIKINSIYGSFGSTTFRLYNLYTAASTTGTAQSLISTTAEAIESFLTNNVRFKSIDEVLVFLNQVTSKHDWEFDYTIIPVICSDTVVFDRLWNHFFDESLKTYSAEMMIRMYLHNCDEEELTRIYYRNNLYAFMDTKLMSGLMMQVLSNIGKDGFRNPNNVPKEIVSDMELIWKYLSEFVFHNYAATERINRLVNDKRKSVILIDTDSNMINIEPWVQYLLDKFWPEIDTPLSYDDKVYAGVNTIAYFLTQMIRETLRKYCNDANVLERLAPRINMKNEFYFKKILLANVKKRYSALIKLKEGKELNPPKLDIKGHDFRKAGVNDDIAVSLISIIQKYIMATDQVNIPMILQNLDLLEMDIRESLKHGSRKYLLRMNCKSELAYKDPYSQGAVLGVILWNTIYPNRVIDVPDKLDMVYLDIPKESSLARIDSSFPEVANTIRKYMFHGHNSERYTRNGIKYLALPNDGQPIPEWAIPFINVNKIVSRNIGTFDPVLTALGLPEAKGTSNDEIKYFSNILDI